MAEPLLVVVGPTASGKSALALDLAARFGGEIVSVDSAQVYRGFDAATSKPDAAQRRAVRHHLIDVADPGEDFSAGDFSRLASAAISEIHGRGRRAILCGGTGLYLRALLQGIAGMPPRHPSLRSALARWGERRGEFALHAMLAAHDPAASERLGPRDSQRILRALEVILQTGRPFSSALGDSPYREGRYRTVKVGVAMPRAILDARIDSRVESFFAAGLIEEADSHLRSGVPREANAFKAIGYREALEHLAGARSLEETVALVKQRTRRYARRQITWFRREPDVEWFGMSGNPEARAGDIEAHIARRLDSAGE